MPEKILCHSCTDCKVVNCAAHNKAYPSFCLTTHLDPQELEEVVELYTRDEAVHKIAIASAQVEGGFYGKYTRVEETVEFAKRIGAKKVGIATCVALMKESAIFAGILKKHGFEVYGVACKVGAVDKTTIGIEDEYIRNRGDSICNPIMQAKLLNKEKTDLNVLIGLCVGHDSLFYRYSDAFVTTLVVKDRVTCHNPAAPLYLTETFYRKLLE